VFKKLDRYFKKIDEKGSIEGLVNEGCWQEINLISSKGGVIRGNHYHRNTRELFIILKGKIKVILQAVEDNRLKGEKLEVFVTEGDVLIIEPNVYHTFFPEIDSLWLNALTVKNDPTNPDFHEI